MAENPIVTDAAWSCTITSGSAIVALIGILGPATGAAAGDFLLDAAGVPLALEAVGDATYTLARPAAAASAGTVQLKWMKGPHRSLAALSTQKTVDVYTRQQIAIDDSRSQPVIAWQNDPPGTPAHNDRYLVKVGTGAWAGKDGAYAKYNTSGTPGWLFTSPRAGDRASINGSRVRLEFDGTSWGTAAAVSSATTAGRLARFTDTAGGLGQSQMSEDGSGNVTMTGSVSASGSGIGFVRMVPGDAGRSGYLAFYNAAGVRQGYIGDVAAGLITLYAEAGNAWSVNGAMSVSGNLGVGGANDGTYGAFRVFGSGYQAMAVQSSSGVIGVMAANANTEIRLGALSNHPVSFYTNNVNRGGFLSTGEFRVYKASASDVTLSLFQTGVRDWQFINRATVGTLAINNGVSDLVTIDPLTGKSAFVGTVTSPNFTATVGAVGANGYLSALPGDANSTGYMEFRHKDGTRRGWIGYASAGYINMVAEGGYSWSISGDLGVSGTLTATSTATIGGHLAVGGTVNQLGLGRTITIDSPGAGSYAGLEWATGGALRALFIANDAAAIAGSFTNIPFYLRQNNVDRVTITSSAITAALPLGLKTYTLGTLPSAAAHSGETVRVTDGASNKQIVTSDGSVWRYSDGVSV